MTRPSFPPPVGSGDDPHPFTPVPVRARHDGWTPDRQRGFISALARIGVVSAAARHVGKSTKSAYTLRDRPDAAAFAAAWRIAQKEGLLRARDLVLGRALAGTTVPIFYRGRQVGERRVFDDRIVLAAAKLLMAELGRSPAPNALDDQPFVDVSA